MAQKTTEKPQRWGIRTIIGTAVFSVGMILSVVAGIWWPAHANFILPLVILGIAVGALNITTKEVIPFLIAAIALVVVGQVGFLPLDNLVTDLGTTLTDIVVYFAIFMSPAALISAVRALVRLGFPGE
jgi:hypothetical protein